MQEDIWIPTLCESNCADAPCLLQVHRINGVVVGIKPNNELGNFETEVKNQGRLCPKAYGHIQKIYNPNRIASPLKRTNPKKGPGQDPGWVAISWDEALDTIAQRLKEIRTRNPRLLAEGGGIGGMRQALWRPFFQAFGPTQSLIGGRSTRCDQNEHAFANRIHGAFQCEPDLTYCNYLILFGSNTSASGGASEGVLFAEARERGMKTVVIDPVLSVTAAKADEWVPIRPCTDLAFMMAMIYVIIHESGNYDKPFLKEMTNSPYLVTPDGDWLRHPESRKVMIWDSSEHKAKAYDAEDIKDYALEGAYSVEGQTVRPAFELLKGHVKAYTPEWAAGITDVSAKVIRRISEAFIENARIGETLETENGVIPYRPAATKMGRGVSGVMRSYQAVLANHILAALIGSIEVPGGHMGGHTFAGGKRKNGILWKQYPLDAGVVAGEDGMREVNHYPFIWPPLTYGAIETLCPFSDYAKVSPPFDDPGEFHFQMDHLNWRNLIDPPQGLPIPLPPKMWIRYRTNPILGLGEPGTIIEVMKKIPFTVSISYLLDEVAEYADIVLPEQVEFERFMPYFNIRSACHRKYFMLAIAQPVASPTGAMNLNDILIELAERCGMIDELNEMINRKLGLDEVSCLKPGRPYQWEEITDRMCKTYTDGAYDLEWFKKNGAITRRAEVEDQYDIHPAMKNAGLRYPIPYMLEVKKTGDELKDKLKHVGIDWWPTEEYTSLPTYFPSKLDEMPPEYDFYVTTCRIIMFSYGSNANLPWINELGAHLPDQMNVLMNSDAAEALGIKQGDEVWVESPYGKVRREVVLRQGIRPDTILIAGQFGQYATPGAKETGRVTQSALLPISYEWTDPLTGNQQGFSVKAKVYKV